MKLCKFAHFSIENFGGDLSHRSMRNDLPQSSKRARTCLACRVLTVRNMAVFGGAIFKSPVLSLVRQDL